MLAVPAVQADTTEEPEENRNFEYFVDALGPDFQDHLDDAGVLETPEGTQIMTGEEFAELLADRADQAGMDLGDLGEDVPTNHGTFPQAGSFIALIEFAFGSSGSTPTCNRGGGGTGGHYDSAVATPAQGHVSNSVFLTTGAGPGAAVGANAGAWVWPYVGTASSSISTHGAGVLFHLSPSASATVGSNGASVAGDAFLYSTPVHYEGTSDFWCVNFSFFGTTFTVNFPFLGGTVDG